MRHTEWAPGINLVAGVCLALAASAALFLVLITDRGVAWAEAEGTPDPVEHGPVVVWETAIPEDWPAGQANHIIFSLQAYSHDGGALTFALRESDDALKFSLIPAGVNDSGNHVAHLVLKEGERLDYEAQDLYLIGIEVRTETGGITELLLRLRVIDVDEFAPAPTASATPAPSPIPPDPCFIAISGEVDMLGNWDGSCLSENRPNDSRAGNYYSRFFTFTLDVAATLSIRLDSEIDTYLYLMTGKGRDGDIVARNDDVAPHMDLNSEIVEQELEAGDYTIEATAYDAEKTGSFTLVVSGLPAIEEPEIDEPVVDCTSGGAVSDASESPELVADCEALLELRDTLKGSAQLNWATDLPMEDWDGVHLGGSPVRVTGLILDEWGLSGRLPSGLSRLSALESLSLAGNGLTGTIPAELGNLSGLKLLALDGNRLTGGIPSELGNLASLETLALSDNILSGEIPGSLSKLGKVRVLLLADNRLTGEFPPWLGSLANLIDLKVAGNVLSGCISPVLYDVADNDLLLTGLEPCASGECANGSAVEMPDDNLGLVADCNALLASRDELAGDAQLNWSVDVPIQEWEGVRVGGSPERVVHLVLNRRGLTGTLPAELGMLSHLTLLQITGNEVTGAIPRDLGRLRELQLLVLADNDLSGEIPPEFDGLASLSHLNLSNNSLTGTLPRELSSLTDLTSLYVDDNQLEGELPEGFGNLRKLKFLYLNDNELSGELPADLGRISTLKVLSLDGNRLTGPIPPELGSLLSLEVLSLEGNLLRGAIPAELGRLSRLQVLSLAANRLTGEIPAQLGAIHGLRRLSLHSNGFTGCIPKELADVPVNDLNSLGLKYCGEGKCAGGTAVAHPNANYGLVSDCTSLLEAVDKLAGSATLNWSTELAIENWDGVTISRSPRRISELNLSGRVLDGEVSHELANITELRVLDLSNNRLTGTIPSELSRLSNLRVLLLSDNRLHGQIPHDLARLENLVQLRLSSNSLAGCVPDELVDVVDNDLDEFRNLPPCGDVDCSSGLAVADPADNRGLVADCETLFGMRDELAGGAYLNWSVHIAIDQWEGITIGRSRERVAGIDLADAGLSGNLPEALGDLAGLEVLILSGNELRGRIPSEIGKLSSLKRLLLDDNMLSGDVSPELAVLSGLDEIRLSGNQLGGCIPPALGEVPANDLDVLGLDFCDAGECSTGAAIEDPSANPGLVADCDALLGARDTLRGGGILNWSADLDISEWFGVTVGGYPRRVTKLRLSSFRLDGEIAPELGRLEKLEELTLSRNRLSGEIPAELGGLSNLKTLSLSRNRLVGELPSQLGSLTALEHLSLSDNRLAGGLPAELGFLINLEHLSIAGNRLTGEIPLELGMLANLRYLSMSNNGLTGSVPTQFGGLTELRYLRLVDNGLNGMIPPELSGLSMLRSLQLSRNRLSGEIPAELGQLEDLRTLHLSDNDLAGRIPSELGRLSELTELYLSANELSGSIPAELGDLTNLVQLYLPRNQLTGEIPSELGSLSNLLHLFLGGNRLTGCIAEGLSDVAHNDLSQLNLPDCDEE